MLALFMCLRISGITLNVHTVSIAVSSTGADSQTLLVEVTHTSTEQCLIEVTHTSTEQCLIEVTRTSTEQCLIEVTHVRRATFDRGYTRPQSNV